MSQHSSSMTRRRARPRCTRDFIPDSENAAVQMFPDTEFDVTLPQQDGEPATCTGSNGDTCNCFVAASPAFPAVASYRPRRMFPHHLARRRLRPAMVEERAEAGSGLELS